MDTTEQYKPEASGDCPPVLFLIFNRPEMSRRVLEQIRAAQPRKLFIAADGPRDGKPGEADLCEITRRTMLELVDWPCEVKTLFREKNMGCKLAVSSAIDWFFKEVDSGIILEDDCRPDPSFFPFCKKLLEKYRDNEQIMMISGNCHLPKKHRPANSYYFSDFTYIWGWATWRRAWKHMDLQLDGWPAFKQANHFPGGMSPRMKKWWLRTFDLNHGQGSSWAIAWQFSCWKKRGISITPARNLVSHIDTTGTHMKPYDPLVGRSAEKIPFPLVHPECTVADYNADRLTEHLVRRSVLKNLQLIFSYLIHLPFNKKTNVRDGISQLIASLKTEISHRRNLRKPQ